MYALRMTRVSLLLIFLVHFDLGISLSEGPRYYTLIPSSHDPNNEREKYITLSQFVNNSSDYLSENTTLHFLQGEHSLESTLFINNIDTFYVSSQDSNVTIVCNHSSWFEFNNVSVVHISGLTFIGCTGNRFTHISQFTLEDSQFIGHKQINGTALELVETSATFIKTELSFNYANKVTTLHCENDDYHYYDVYYDFLNTHYDYGFQDIEVDVTAGGAIVLTHSNVTIIDSVFEGNHAQAGGAIFAELQSNIIIINSTFVGNQATSLQSHQYCYAGGGVLYCDNGSSIKVYSSTFERNTAHWLGGVMAAGLHDSVTITITNSDFISNAAHYFGGVLSGGAHSSITITNSNFTKNRVNYAGGVVYLSSAEHSIIIITNSNFTKNSANNRGGVLDLSHADYSNTTITNSNFRENSANNYGGVVDLSSAEHSIITITNSNFTKNSAANDNSGVLHLSYAHYSSITITNNDFTENSAKNGGVLDLSRADSSSLTIYKSEFIGNRAQNRGGAISVNEYCLNITITINSCNFTNNNANQGGTVYSNGNFYYYTQISIMASTFVNNTAHHVGGVLNTLYATVTITQSAFVENKAISEGGTMHIIGGTVTINYSQFHHNMARYGGMIWAQQASIRSHDTSWNQNSANIAGGVLYTQQSTTIITKANFSHNRANTDGGVLHTAQQSTTVITGANFSNNRANNSGGTMYTDGATTSITDCTFNHNTAGNDGGVIRSYLSEIDISESECSGNSANNDGGVFSIDQTNLAIDQTSFTDNKARDGGVLWIDQGVLTINKSFFAENNASSGGVMWAEQVTINADRVNFTCNHANLGVVYVIESISDWARFLYSDNIGSLFAFGGTINIKNSHFNNNVQPNYSTLQKRGGAITVIQSEIKFDGNTLLRKGRAESGGALKAMDSKVHIHGNVTIANNTATEAGGGIYLYHSELNIWKSSALNIWNNTATEKGGGIYAISSVIKVKHPSVNHTSSSLHFDSNQAMNGGGLFMEMDTKIYVLKSKIYLSKPTTNHQRLVFFSLNSAKYGGAIYVSDNGMCSLSTDNECFVQALAMYGPMHADIDTRYNYKNIDFANNTAEFLGNSLFGGLLDRCSVSQFAETNINNVNMDYTISNGTMIVEGHEYFQKISNIQDTDIGSHPIQVCFCNNGYPDCTYQHDLIQVRKGQQTNISLSLAVVDQIDKPLHEATVYSHFHSGNYICQNHIHSMNGSCSEVNFAVFSYNDTEELILSLSEGPCKDTRKSKARVTLEFFCPQCFVGFELDDSGEGCRCVCDSQLFPYFTNCSGKTLTRERNVWVTNLTTNHTPNVNQYLIHPYCPFDYCHSPNSRVEVNLNIANGADTQCANNRAGLLCGTCQHNFSLSLGSSHCLPCSTHWLAILITIIIAAILVGIVLVALLFALNLTVAIGTLNGIIFYANIVYANNSVFLPFTERFNFITIFISWLNLDIGFDTCFFVGMDAYSKTLLQLAFPVYVLFLVFMVIIISNHSMRFSKLIGKRNPVATLATLISFSYAKLLHITIASLSFTILNYPDGSRTYVWLVDANVSYLSGKHIVLFMIALLIIIAGVCYTTLLLFWQWLLHHQDKTMFRWTKYQKFCHFIEPYHAPYTLKHRYWAGLLLLVRVVLYIVFALNVNGDSRVNLVAIILTVGGLLLTKGFLVKVYKKWPIDVMESIMYFNILGFAALTWYYIGTPKRQTAVAYTSVTITLLFLLMVISFHVYNFTIMGSIIRKNKVFKVLAAYFLDNKKAKDATDADKKSIQHEQEVSFSVVEVPQPILERAEPEIHIQLKPQELPCYTPENTLEQQESEIQELGNSEL